MLRKGTYNTINRFWGMAVKAEDSTRVSHCIMSKDIIV
jgi:hypothetical protein